MRDVIFHTQWCAGLGMVAVQWPLFSCKLSGLAVFLVLIVFRPCIGTSSMVYSHIQYVRLTASLCCSLYQCSLFRRHLPDSGR